MKEYCSYSVLIIVIPYQNRLVITPPPVLEQEGITTYMGGGFFYSINFFKRKDEKVLELGQQNI